MDNKKLFPENKSSKKRLMEFFDKKGFYIVLILCIAIVGATAVFVTTHNLSSSKIDFSSQKVVPDENGNNFAFGDSGKETVQSAVTAPVNADSQKSITNKATDTKKATPTPGKGQQTDPKAAKPGDKATTNTSVKNSEKAVDQKFILPVFGEVTFDYSQDKLVYSKTLEEWRTHSGLDLAADRGAPVKAVADGVVSEIKSDPRLGYIVVIDHQNGLKTVYANLANDSMVSPNQKVKQGDVIGGVGSTASFESAEQAHVHFEVWKNNQPMNPAAYLPKK